MHNSVCSMRSCVSMLAIRKAHARKAFFLEEVCAQSVEGVLRQH